MRLPSSKWRSAIYVGLITTLLLVLYGPSLRDHMLASEVYIDDDACIHLAPYLRILGDGPEDYVERYGRACHPLGFRMAMQGLQKLGVVEEVNRFSRYVLLPVFLVFLGLAAWRLGGWPAATAACVLAVSADYFIRTMAGAMPRAAGFPLLAAILAAAVWGKPWLLAAATIAGCLFYPSTGVVGGATLALLLFVMPTADQGRSRTWSWRQRLALLAGTAAACVLVLVPPMLGSARFAPTAAGPVARATYPETGNSGRCAIADRFDFDLSLAAGIDLSAGKALVNGGDAFCAPLRDRLVPNGMFRRPFSEWPTICLPTLALFLIGVLWKVCTGPPGRRFLAVALATMLAYLSARGLTPWLFLPQRYLAYTVPVLTLIGLVTGVAAVGALAARLVRARGPSALPAVVRGATMLVFTAACLLCFGGRVDQRIGQTFNTSKDPVYGYFASLEDNVYVAGWPYWLSPISVIAAQPVLVSQETHLPYHQGYLDEMRGRMRALIDAYFATSLEPILALREEHGVTHLLVDRGHMQGRGIVYIEPFKTWARATYAETLGTPLVIPSLRKAAEVYADKRVYVLDLRKLGPASFAGPLSDARPPGRPGS